MNGGWGISHKTALRWMPLDLTDDKSTLVQVMAWCRQATSHYLSQCWPRSMSPNGVTRLQWVKCNLQTDVMDWVHEHFFYSLLSLMWMPYNIFDDKSTLVQAMAWCHHATVNHYLSQCWRRSLWPYGITRAEWIHSSRLRWTVAI